MFWIYDYPTWEMALLFTLGMAAFAVIGVLLFRRVCGAWLHRDDKVNDMVGFAMSSFSMLYGLLLGLLAVAAYQGFADTSSLTDRESTILATLHGATATLPDPLGNDLQAELRRYTRNVIDVSWPEQRRGIVPTEAGHILEIYLGKLHGFEPQTMREQNVQSEALSLANELVQIRRTRLLSVDGGIPEILWWVVLAGAAINILLVWMLDMARHSHIILSAMVGGFLGLVIFLVAAMDYPFRGAVSVGPDSFEFVYETVMKAGPGAQTTPQTMVDKTATTP
jgi:Protein of unknown function (DUF4239)